MHIRILPFGQCMRRIRIPPSFVVPVIDVLTQDDQLRARNRLQAIEFLHELIGWWATGTAFGGE
jgi:hypothetical protein